MNGAGGLVAVHAHPDDETLSTGALLAAWAAAGRPVTVVTATRGERGEVIPAALRHLQGDGPGLAAHRSGELAAALAALGVTDHVFLDTLPDGPLAERRVDRRDRVFRTPEGAVSATTVALAGGAGVRYEDSGMAWVGTGQAGPGADVAAGAFVGVPLEAAAGRLAGLLRARRPAVVVTYDPQGGYGHPDHIRVHQVTMRAVELASDGGWRPAVWWRRTGRAQLAAGYRALRGPAVRAALGAAYHQLSLPDPDGPFPAVAVADDRIDLTVAVTADRVLAALAAYPTQVQAVTAVPGQDAIVGCYALSDGVLAPLLPDEGYVRIPAAHARRLL